ILSHNIIYIFFQAEDGIRDRNVTGVQTCALPISTPSYNSFPNLIKGNDRKIVETPLIYDESKKEYFLNTEEFTNLCAREDVTLYIHCNPHNPTGKVWSKEELSEIKKICQENNVYLISDEIHMDFVRPKEDFVS